MLCDLLSGLIATAIDDLINENSFPVVFARCKRDEKAIYRHYMIESKNLIRYTETERTKSSVHLF